MGTGTVSQSPAVTDHRSTHPIALFNHFWWNMRVSFGVPVLPDVRGEYRPCGASCGRRLRREGLLATHAEAVLGRKADPRARRRRAMRSRCEQGVQVMESGVLAFFARPARLGREHDVVASALRVQSASAPARFRMSTSEAPPACSFDISPRAK